MGTRATLISSGLVALSALPFIAFAASTSFFGPIVPQGGSCLCDTAMNWGCVLVVFQNVQNALVSLGVLAVVFFIAMAGFSLMTGGSNPGTRQKAVNRMLNAVVGLVLILGSWLIVDTVMKYLYDPTTAFSGQQFGPWNTILGGDPKSYCLALNQHPGQLTNGTTLGEAIHSVVNPGTQGSTGGANNVPGPSTRGLCTPSALQTAGWSPALASQMSCVTRFENGACDPSAPSGTDIGSDHRSVSFGIFQVNISADNLNYPACEAKNGGQPLNCTKAFDGGAYTGSNHNTHVAPGKLDQYNVCRAAASDPACNTAAAQTIRNNKKGIGNWGVAAQQNCG